MPTLGRDSGLDPMRAAGAVEMETRDEVRGGDYAREAAVPVTISDTTPAASNPPV